MIETRRAVALKVGREAAIMAAAVACYFVVRNLTQGSRAAALENADRVVRLQDRLGIGWEERMQSVVVDSDVLVTLANWVYMFGHWPVIAAVAVWLVVRRPEMYFLTRNAFLISGALGLIVFATFPVAPPRLTDGDYVDTVSDRSNSYRVLQPPGFTNQYAAMPSLHFGWNVLIGIAMWRTMKRGMRVVAVGLPVAMALAVVLTANHFVLDAVVGAAFALFGLLVAWRIHQGGAAEAGAA